jgi:hypothetical protein
MIFEPLQFCNSRELFHSQKQSRVLAQTAWREMEAQDSLSDVSDDYGAGFRKGYADFLEFGGQGLPPAVPPRPYWRTKRKSTNNRQAVQDWFDGFTHGASAAQESGLREVLVLPTSLQLVPAFAPSANSQLPEEELPVPPTLDPRPSIENDGVEQAKMSMSSINARSHNAPHDENEFVLRIPDYRGN